MNAAFATPLSAGTSYSISLSAQNVGSNNASDNVKLSTNGLIFGTESTKLFYGVGDYFNGNYSATITSSAWHNYVLTFTSTTVNLYIDGVFQESKAFSSPSLTTVEIGDWLADRGAFDFKGNIDDVRVYNTAVSAQDVSNLYAGIPQWNVGTASITATNNITTDIMGTTLTAGAGKNITLTAGGSIINDSVGTVSGSQSSGSGGNITLAANATNFATIPTISTNGNVTFEPDTASTTIGVAGGAGSLAITSGILGDVTAGSVTIGNTADTGATTVNAYTWAVPLTLISGSGPITISGAQTMGTHSLTLETDGTLSIGADLASSGTGTLTIEPATASDTIGVNETSGSTLLITPTDLGYINSQGWANLTIGNSSDSGAMTLPATIFASDGVTSFITGGSGSITVTGTQTGTGTTAFSFTGPTTINANLTTANQNITFGSAVTLGANSIVNSGTATTDFASTVAGSSYNLTLTGDNLTLGGNMTGTGAHHHPALHRKHQPAHQRRHVERPTTSPASRSATSRTPVGAASPSATAATPAA